MANRSTKIVGWGLLFFGMSLQLCADNLGVMGTLYPISEPDGIEMLQQHFKAFQDNGGLARLQQQVNETIQQQFDMPRPVTHLFTTTLSRTRYFDPSLNLLTGAVKHNNPLINHPLTSALIFYNADEPTHVVLVESLSRIYKNRVKLILVQGSVLKQQKHFKHAIYFDQGGYLAARFQLTHVPAVITQHGSQLAIQEIVP